jgi:hypothetical protein
MFTEKLYSPSFAEGCITCRHGSARQVVIGHVAFKRKGSFSRPHRARTTQPIYTKLGTFDYLVHITHLANFGHDWPLRVVWAVWWNIHLWFLPFPFFFSFNPVNMVGLLSLIRQTTCSLVYSNLHISDSVQPNFKGSLPLKPPFFPKSRLFATDPLTWTYRPNRLIFGRRKWLEWRHSMTATALVRKKSLTLPSGITSSPKAADLGGTLIS